MSIKNTLLIFILAFSNLVLCQTDSLINVHPSTEIIDKRKVVEESISLDAQTLSFDDFEGLLGKDNVELLGNIGGFPMFGVGVVRNRKYFSWEFGYVSKNVELDSIDAYMFSTQAQFNIGYSILDTRRWRITPEASIKWLRFTLDNHNKEKKIPLGQFLTDRRTLDIRFNQLMGNVGMRFDFKIYGLEKRLDFITVGLYGGYAVGLHAKPLIRSKYSRLTHDKKIDINPWNFRLIFGFDGFLRRRSTHTYYDAPR